VLLPVGVTNVKTFAWAIGTKTASTVSAINKDALLLRRFMLVPSPFWLFDTRPQSTAEFEQDPTDSVKQVSAQIT